MALPRTAFLAAALLAGAALAQTAPPKVSGETLYLPIYSHIWYGEVNRSGTPSKALLSISVSIRNTDPASPIRVHSAQYYDTDGKRLKEYVPQPKTVGPMGTLELFIPRSDDTGGSGANFLILWTAKTPVSPPLVHGVHAILPAGGSVVFTTSAQAIDSR